MQMELCKSSLEAYIIEIGGRIDEEMVWSILSDLLQGLKCIHDKNLIHLDIKLENILITDDSICKLADFGLVIDLNRENLHLATEGDSRYIAPELMLGKFTKAADIFSLGIAIFELSTNLELPSNGLLWQQLRSGDLPTEFLSVISNDLQTIIKSMMAPQPSDRPNVDTLLTHPRLKTFQLNRRKWNRQLRKIRTFYRTFNRFLIRKYNEIKCFILEQWSLGFLRIRSGPTTTPAATTTPMMMMMDVDEQGSDDLLERLDESIILKQQQLQHDMTNNCDDRCSVNQDDLYNGSPEFQCFSNSTPLNHHQPSLRQSRKSIPRINLV